MGRIFRLLLILVLFSVLASSVIAEKNLLEKSIIAKKFDFIPNRIEVLRGERVKLYITSVDVAHGIAIDALGINKEIQKGELTIVEFTPDKVGEFEIKCSVYCGFGHGGMKGKLIVTGYRDISADELKDAMKNKDFFLVDVHIPEQKHIKGTDAFIPFNKIEKHAGKLPEDKNTKIIVYCRSGSMSVTASKVLQKLGYRNIYNLVGGIKEWNRKGY
jgi:rhodanese-related sulfurtransferase